MYSCEASAIDITSLFSYSVAVARALDNSAQYHSQHLIYNFSGIDYVMEPFSAILVSRVKSFVRCSANGLVASISLVRSIMLTVLGFLVIDVETKELN